MYHIKRAKYYEKLQKVLEEYPEEARKQDLLGGDKLVEYTKQIVKSEFKFADIDDNLDDDDEAEFIETIRATNEPV